MAFKVTAVHQGPNDPPTFDNGSGAVGIQLLCPRPNSGNPATSPNPACDHPEAYTCVLIYPKGETDIWKAKEAQAGDSLDAKTELIILPGGKCALADANGDERVRAYHNAGKLKLEVLNPKSIQAVKGTPQFGIRKKQQSKQSRSKRKEIVLLNYSGAYTITIGSDTTTILG